MNQEQEFNTGMSPEEMVQMAAKDADLAHRGQKYGDRPYYEHLVETHRWARILTGGEDWEIEAAALLHDVLEDTTTTFEYIYSTYGARVARLIDAVTDGKGATRAERKARVYQAMCQDEDVCTLKLADRLANVQASVKSDHSSMLAIYRSELPAFQKALIDGMKKVHWANLYLAKLLSGEEIKDVYFGTGRRQFINEETEVTNFNLRRGTGKLSDILPGKVHVGVPATLTCPRCERDKIAIPSPETEAVRCGVCRLEMAIFDNQLHIRE